METVCAKKLNEPVDGESAHICLIKTHSQFFGLFKANIVLQKLKNFAQILSLNFRACFTVRVSREVKMVENLLDLGNFVIL